MTRQRWTAGALGAAVLAFIVLGVPLTILLVLGPASSTCSSTPGDPTVPTTETATAAQMVRYLISQGLTPNAAAGVVGNLQQESSLNPTESDGAGGGGLAQWNAGWYSQMAAYATAHGLPPTSSAGQLMYLVWDLRGPYAWLLAKLNAAPDPGTAAFMFETGYEKCQGVTGFMVPVPPGALCMDSNRRLYAAMALAAAGGAQHRCARQLRHRRAVRRLSPVRRRQRPRSDPRLPPRPRRHGRRRMREPRHADHRPRPKHARRGPAGLVRRPAAAPVPLHPAARRDARRRPVLVRRRTDHASHRANRDHVPGAPGRRALCPVGNLHRDRLGLADLKRTDARRPDGRRRCSEPAHGRAHHAGARRSSASFRSHGSVNRHDPSPRAPRPAINSDTPKEAAVMHEPSDGIAEELKRQLQLDARRCRDRRTTRNRRPAACARARGWVRGGDPAGTDPPNVLPADQLPREVEASRACNDPGAAGRRVVENRWSETTEVRYG